MHALHAILDKSEFMQNIFLLLLSLGNK